MGAETCLMTSGTHEMSKILLVNGAATDASVSDNEMPTFIAFEMS